MHGPSAHARLADPRERAIRAEAGRGAALPDRLRDALERAYVSSQAHPAPFQTRRCSSVASRAHQANRLGGRGNQRVSRATTSVGGRPRS